MLSTEINLADALITAQQMCPSDWGYVSEMCIEALLRLGSPRNEQPSSPSEENSTAEYSSYFGLSSSMYHLTDIVTPSAPSTTSSSDAASICSSFTAAQAEASAPTCCPSFCPDVPANAMRPSITMLLSSLVSEDTNSPESAASPMCSTSDTSSSVSTASKSNYYREHTYISPPTERVVPFPSQPVRPSNILAQPTLSSDMPTSQELVATIRQPSVQSTRFSPYCGKDRPPTLAAKVMTSSSSFSFADQTFSPKPYAPSKCSSLTENDHENETHLKVFCRKGYYPKLVAAHGIDEQTFYYGWKTNYVTCYIPGCNQEVIKNTRAEITRHAKKFHLCAEDPQYVLRDCCPAASPADRNMKADMVYGHFQTERHSRLYNSYQYSCGYCGDLVARPDQLYSHFIECLALRNHAHSLKFGSPQPSLHSASLSLGA